MTTPALSTAVGDLLPVFEREATLEHWNRYAAVNDEFIAIHMDDGAGRAAGYPSAFGMGNLQWAYLHALLRQWMGDAGRIHSLSCRFQAPSLKGGTVTAAGRVSRVADADPWVEVSVDVWTVDQDGQRLTTGDAVVVLDPARTRRDDPTSCGLYPHLSILWSEPSTPPQKEPGTAKDVGKMWARDAAPTKNQR